MRDRSFDIAATHLVPRRCGSRSISILAQRSMLHAVRVVERQPATFADLADLAGMDPSTAACVLRCLEEHGFIERSMAGNGEVNDRQRSGRVPNVYAINWTYVVANRNCRWWPGKYAPSTREAVPA